MFLHIQSTIILFTNFGDSPDGLIFPHGQQIWPPMYIGWSSSERQALELWIKWPIKVSKLIDFNLKRRNNYLIENKDKLK